MNKLIYILMIIFVCGCSTKTPYKNKIKKLEFSDIDSSILTRANSQVPFLFLCECKKK